ncbi:MAG: ATP-binding protein [Candidatus Krumholzibacteriia bacterium]
MTAAVLALLFGLAEFPGAGLPYVVQPVAATGLTSKTVVRGLLAADLDGDGTEELVSGVATGVLVYGWRGDASFTPSQMNLPPRYLGPGASIDLGAASDVDGDGRREVIATACTADGWDHRLWILDPLAGTLRLDLALPTGEDLRPDGKWDGHHQVLGVVPGADGPLIIVIRRVDYDLRPRGILAYAADGRLVWSVPTAGSPHLSVLTDLDGDGRPEIVTGVGSGGNLRPGQEVGGRLDDEAAVLALAADGSLLWERRIPTLFTGPRPVACDLDGDGVVEIVVAAQCYSEGGRESVTVLAGPSGAVLAQAHPEAPGLGLAAWPVAPGRGMVACATNDARLTLYTYADGALRQERSRRFDAGIVELRTMDLLPAPEPELLVRLLDQRMLLLAADLRPLAQLPDWAGRGTPQIPWRTDAGPLLMYPNAWNAGLRLVPTPWAQRIGVPAAAGALLVGAGLAGGTFLRQRRRLGRLRRTSRLDLLRAFLTSRHGTVGPVGALDRVMWAVDNPAPDGAARLAAAWSACRAEAIPDLQALLEKAAHIRLDPPLLAIVRRELAAFGHSLDGLVGMAADDRHRPGLVAAARTSLGLVGDGVRSLGATLAASCRLDPGPLVREVAACHAARHPTVEFAVTVAPAAAGRQGHADHADLEFAVDNLLDNAARQVAGRPDARVDVLIDATADHLVIAVTDNGPGVPATDRERIFAAGTTTKTQGGGLGLWHSRQALRYYGGDLLLADAPAGGGARFTVVLRAASG